MFDDRIEVRSPGLPPEPVTVEALNRRERLHLSRNPLIVRLLAELGYMREVGEGIQRMFAVMEREGFYPPRFANIGNLFFEVTLRNQPVYDRATLEWLRQFEPLELSGDQKRLLAYAHARGGTFTSREYQKLVGLDLYSASNSIKVLMRKGIVRSLGKGSRVYEVVGPTAATPEVPTTLAGLLPLFGRQAEIANEDIRQTLGVSRASATRLASDLCEAGWLGRRGTGRWARYRLLRQPMPQSLHTSSSTRTDA